MNGRGGGRNNVVVFTKDVFLFILNNNKRTHMHENTDVEKLLCSGVKQNKK